MIINKKINKETFDSLMEMYKRQGVKVTGKVLDNNFVSYVVESTQHIFIDDIKDFPVGLIGNYTTQFINEMYESKFDFSNKEKNVMPDVKIGDSRIAYGYSDGKLKIYSIRTPPTKRGNGSARLAMQEFLKQADQEGLDVYLDSSPLDNKTNGNKLIQFYQSLGFEETGNKINSVGDPEMVRKSKKGINESAELNFKHYINNHGKKPTGKGKWIFGIGSRKSADWLELKGNFAKVAKKALAQAEELGKKKVYVMEGLGGENIDLCYNVELDKNVYRVSVIKENNEIAVTQSITQTGGETTAKKIILANLDECVKVNNTQVIPDAKVIVEGIRGSISSFKYRYLKEDTFLDDRNIFSIALKQLGFDIDDAPFPPIRKDWESFPIIKAIRRVEKETGIKYESLGMNKSVIEKYDEEHDPDYLKEDESDPNIGRKWMNRYGQEIQIEYLKDGRYYTLVDGKVMGGEIIPVDQLEKTIQIDTKWYEHKLKTDKELDDQEAADLAAKQAKADKYSSIGGNALQKGRTIKALDRQVRYKGNVTTIKDLIDSKIADGWIVADNSEGSVLEDPVNEIFLSQKVLGRTGINYARQVLNQTNESVIEKDTSSSIEKEDPELTPEPYTEEEGSTFESNGNFYDLNKILELADTIKEVEDFDVSTLEWVLDYDKASLDDLKSAEERVASADKNIPILIYLDQAQPENEEYVIVDGVHRLAKAIIDGDKTIPAKILTDEMMDLAFIPQEEEAITEAKTYTQRSPYKVIKVKNIYGVEYFRVQDKTGTLLGGEFEDKKDADVLVKNLNSVTEIELHEATKSFEVKYKSTDGTNVIEGTKTISAPDSSKARSRFMEDNTELKGLQVTSVNEVR